MVRARNVKRVMDALTAVSWTMTILTIERGFKCKLHFSPKPLFFYHKIYGIFTYYFIVSYVK
jgi:hypothetical protein